MRSHEQENIGEVSVSLTKKGYTPAETGGKNLWPMAGRCTIAVHRKEAFAVVILWWGSLAALRFGPYPEQA